MSYTGEGGEASAVANLAESTPHVRMGSGTVGWFVATGELTAGRYGLYRWEMPPHAAGANAHFHRTFSEAFYILEGTVSLYNGVDWGAGAPGDFLYVPEGGIHGFRNDTDEHATMLLLFAPGAAREGYFEELARIALAGREMTPGDWSELYAQYDQTMVEG
jgi:quercetin dioxygenase-like cupin family protein